MKKFYLPPNFRKFMTKKPSGDIKTGKAARKYVQIGNRYMVIPDTFEAEKFEK